MAPKLNCQICDKEIIKDRYNISYVLERQDFPYQSKWQQSTDVFLENVCSECQRKITVNFKNFIFSLRERVT